MAKNRRVRAMRSGAPENQGLPTLRRTEKQARKTIFPA
jgi:hypothetical protein